MAWPDRVDMGQPRAFNLDTLYHSREQALADPVDAYAFQRGDRRLMGFTLPPFQREVVWDEERMASFVESAILGLPIGTWTYNSNSTESGLKTDGDGQYWQYHKWLLDGQQRLTALDRYWSDAFPVFGLHWSEVPERDRRMFLMSTSFPAFETRLGHEPSMRELYDRMNFGGVAHEQSERALPRP